MMDLTSPKVIRSIQDKFGFTFKKGLGQNFLTSNDILEDITDAADIDGGVIEIGPGFGVLTRALAERAEKVISIELDERLLPVLQYTLSDFDNVKIVNADVLKLDLHSLIQEEFGSQKVSIAANLPYYITTPIITRLLEEKLPVKNIVVMVQKEVAERMAAEPSTKDYGAITVLCKYFTKPQIVANVPSSLFVPPPKVDSAVLKLEVLDKPAVDVKDEKLFFRVVKAAFSQRRKTLLNCLCANFPINKTDMSELLLQLGIDPKRRGETLSLEEFAAAADAIKSFSEQP
ncbi:16S rRNA (adenine(1518)-N(6)/adenine(1519)-N(6))-dimethyltransferase RsmA [Lachnospiraceae bacterium MD329]|nr:16S rRNA (adenine(1518)-N(6)/adenine(1519)-N(6))-dimethyltransferase RsmA [Lachnospiraceae bacterium MD329]